MLFFRVLCDLALFGVLCGCFGVLGACGSGAGLPSSCGRKEENEMVLQILRRIWRRTRLFNLIVIIILKVSVRQASDGQAVSVF